MPTQNRIKNVASETHSSVANLSCTGEKLKCLPNHLFIANFRELVASERKITREILDHINELERRRLYAELGFSSSFAWLTQELGYSESAAFRRIHAARLLNSLADQCISQEACRSTNRAMEYDSALTQNRAAMTIADKIESGVVNLTTLAQVQTSIRAEEKRTGERMPLEQKQAVIEKIESKSSRAAEAILAEMFPQVVKTRESITVVDQNHVRAHVTLTKSQLQKLERLGELLSHALENSGGRASLGDIIEVAVDELLKQRDPLLKKTRSGVIARTSTQSFAGAGVIAQASAPVCSTTSAPARAPARAPASAALRAHVIRRDHGKCQYRDPQTGRACESRYRLEVDHIIPRAAGGGNEPENLRAMCRTHNLLFAEQWFGNQKMNQFRRDH